MLFFNAGPPTWGPIKGESHFSCITLCKSCDLISSKTNCVRNRIIVSCCWPCGPFVHFCLFGGDSPLRGPIKEESHFSYINPCKSNDSIYLRTICVRVLIKVQRCLPSRPFVHVPLWWRSSFQGPHKGRKSFLFHLRGKATFRDHFVHRVSVCPSVRPSNCHTLPSKPAETTQVSLLSKPTRDTSVFQTPI